MFGRCCSLLYGFIYIGAIELTSSQEQGIDKSVNLALETVFEFDKIDGQSDINLINRVQNFLGKVKNVIENKNVVERRHFDSDRRNLFTNLVLNTAAVLNKFDDDDLERFFIIINDEIQNYCRKYVVNNDVIHNLARVRNTPAQILRWYLKSITNKIDEEAYYEDEKEVIDIVNSLYKQEDIVKFKEFLNNLEDYRRKSRRDINLVQIIKTAVKNILFDQYNMLSPKTRSTLNDIFYQYIEGFMILSTKNPDTIQQTKTSLRIKGTTKEPGTLRLNYVDKNLDLKYNPYAYNYVTETLKRNSNTQTEKRIITVPTTRVPIKHITKIKKIKEYYVNVDESKEMDHSDDESTSWDDTTSMRTTKDRITYKQMYVEKNLDLKYKHYDRARTERAAKQTSLPKGITLNNNVGKLYTVKTRTRDNDKKANHKKVTHKKVLYQKVRRSRKPVYKPSEEYEHIKQIVKSEEIRKAAHGMYHHRTTKVRKATQRVEINSPEYEPPLPLARREPSDVDDEKEAKHPRYEEKIGFSINIKGDEDWNPPKNTMKKVSRKHYRRMPYKTRMEEWKVMQPKMRRQKIQPKLLRMQPISLNMKLTMTKEPLILHKRLAEPTSLPNVYRRAQIGNPAPSEEVGLSIEGFQKTKHKIANRRVDNQNVTVNKNVLTRIQKLEQDLEVVKTKIQNDTVIDKKENSFDNLTKVTEKQAKGLEINAGVNLEKTVKPEVVNVRKFNEYPKKFDKDSENMNIDKDKEFSEEKQYLNIGSENIILNISGVTSVRQTISDHPIVRAHSSESHEIIIERKYEPYFTPLIKESNSTTSSNKLKNSSPFGQDSSTKSKTMYDPLKNVGNNYANRKNNDTVMKDSLNPKSFNKQAEEKISALGIKDETFNHNISAVKNSPKNNVNLNFKQNITKNTSKTNDDKNLMKENVKVTKSYKLNPEFEVNFTPVFRAEIDEINNNIDAIIKEVTTNKNNTKTTLITDYKSLGDSSATTKNAVISTREATAITDSVTAYTKPLRDVGLKLNKLKYNTNNVDIKYNNNAMVVTKLDNVAKTYTTNATTLALY